MDISFLPLFLFSWAIVIAFGLGWNARNKEIERKEVVIEHLRNRIKTLYMAEFEKYEKELKSGEDIPK